MPLNLLEPKYSVLFNLLNIIKYIVSNIDVKKIREDDIYYLSFSLKTS